MALPSFAAPGTEGGPAYVNTNNVDARRHLEEIGAADPASLTEPEQLEWAKARLAWIALDRLEGREEEAIKLFRACGEFCGKYGPAKEMRALRAWGCLRAADAVPCRARPQR